MEQGGVESVVCDLNRALVRAGWRSVVVSRGGRLVARIRADGGEHVTLDLKSKNPLTALPRAWKLRRVLRKVAAGGRRDERDARVLVCAHSRVPAWLFVLARRIDLFFFLLRLHPPKSEVRGRGGEKVEVRGRGGEWTVNIPFSTSCLHLHLIPFITYAHGANSVSRYSAVMTFGDRVVVPSRFLADYLVENYGRGTGRRGRIGDAPLPQTAGRRGRIGDAPLPQTAGGRGAPLRERIRVVHPAVDFARFDPAAVDAAAVAALRREWGVRDGDRTWMSVGRITAVKGFDNVIRAFADEASAGRLVIVGGVDRGKEGVLSGLKRLAADLGVADRVVFAGAQDDIPACLSVADLVVSGNVAKPESFGLSVAEALAMGKPVRLLRRFGGAGEILDEVEKRVAVEAGGGAKYREAVRSLCDFGIMWDRTEKVYEELLR